MSYCKLQVQSYFEGAGFFLHFITLVCDKNQFFQAKYYLRNEFKGDFSNRQVGF